MRCWRMSAKDWMASWRTASEGLVGRNAASVARASAYMPRYSMDSAARIWKWAEATGFERWNWR